MGNRYIIKRENATPVANQDFLTIVSAANRRVRLLQIVVAGMGSTSAAQALIAARSSGGTTGGGAITPNKADHTDQPAAVSTIYTTWSAQPTVDSNGIAIGWNALGGAFVWNAPKGQILEARNGENLSIRCPSAGVTPQACAISVVIDED